MNAGQVIQVLKRVAQSSEIVVDGVPCTAVDILNTAVPGRKIVQISTREIVKPAPAPEPMATEPEPEPEPVVESEPVVETPQPAKRGPGRPRKEG